MDSKKCRKYFEGTRTLMVATPGYNLYTVSANNTQGVLYIFIQPSQWTINTHYKHNHSH